MASAVRVLDSLDGGDERDEVDDIELVDDLGRDCAVSHLTFGPSGLASL